VLVAHAGSVGPAIGDNPLYLPTFSLARSLSLSFSRALSQRRHRHLCKKMGSATISTSCHVCLSFNNLVDHEFVHLPHAAAWDSTKKISAAPL
jgi:hypothetical protein